MFSRGIPLFNLFGFDVRMDPSWLLLALLITWTLGTGFFPLTYPGLTSGSYLAMGALVAVGLFFSIVIHEFAHAWVAQRNGLPMGGITLWLFGGVAEMKHESPNPRTEFLMAAAGPATSILVVILFVGLTVFGTQSGWPRPLLGITSYLATLNGILVIFNLIPAFPLDGGRILRSALWQWKHNLKWATRVTARIGAGFGVILITLGILALISGNFLGGIWQILIGMFLRNAANAAYQQLLRQDASTSDPIAGLISAQPVTVPAGITIQEFMTAYLSRHTMGIYPVVEGKRLVGCIHPDHARKFSTDQWDNHWVQDIMQPCHSQEIIPANMSVSEALERFNQTGASQLLVVESHRLLGTLKLQHLMKALAKDI